MKKEKGKEEQKNKTNQDTLNDSIKNLYVFSTTKIKTKNYLKFRYKKQNKIDKSKKPLPNPIYLKYVRLKISNPFKRKNLSVQNIKKNNYKNKIINHN